MLTDHQNKVCLQSEIIRVEMRLNFIQSGFVRSTEEERRQSELKKASLQFQLKQLENCLDSQISI
jgi:hypothetical protein